MNKDWLLWQLIDSAFPSGGIAHSGGLEAAYQSGIVIDGQRLREFVDAQLRNVAFSAAPFMTQAFRFSERWWDIDRACHVFLCNHVANRASRAQGGAFLAATEKVFNIAPLTEMRFRLRQEKGFGHFAPLLGASLKVMGISERDACQLLFFLTVRGAISSAVRLGIVGPLEGQSIQHALSPNVDKWVTRAQTVSIDDVANTSPMLDLLQATQDRLYSRLFQS